MIRPASGANPTVNTNTPVNFFQKTMLEPDVTLTDYLMAVECLVLAVFLRRQPTRSWAARTWAITFFVALCVGSIAGGTVHGFFPNEQSEGHRIVWLIALNSIGVTALAAWMLGALVLFRVVTWRFRTWAYSQFALSLGLTGFVSREFWTAMVTYLPACVFLSGAVVVAFRRDRDRSYLLVLVGLGLTFVAAAVQQLKHGVHPQYFNHNAVYHVIQGVALWVMSLGCGRLLRALPESGRPD